MGQQVHYDSQRAFIVGSTFSIEPASGSFWGLPGGLEGKASACNAGDPGSIPESGRFPWRRKWQSTPGLLPGKPRAQKTLGGCSPQDPKESDTTEGLHLHFLGVYNFEEMQLMVITINREAESSFTLLTSFIFVSFSKILFFYLNELN